MFEYWYRLKINIKTEENIINIIIFLKLNQLHQQPKRMEFTVIDASSANVAEQIRAAFNSFNSLKRKSNDSKDEATKTKSTRTKTTDGEVKPDDATKKPDDATKKHNVTGGQKKRTDAYDEIAALLQLLCGKPTEVKPKEVIDGCTCADCTIITAKRVALRIKNVICDCEGCKSARIAAAKMLEQIDECIAAKETEEKITSETFIASKKYVELVERQNKEIAKRAAAKAAAAKLEAARLKAEAEEKIKLEAERVKMQEEAEAEAKRIKLKEEADAEAERIKLEEEKLKLKEEEAETEAEKVKLEAEVERITLEAEETAKIINELVKVEEAAMLEEEAKLKKLKLEAEEAARLETEEAARLETEEALRNAEIKLEKAMIEAEKLERRRELEKMRAKEKLRKAEFMLEKAILANLTGSDETTLSTTELKYYFSDKTLYKTVALLKREEEPEYDDDDDDSEDEIDVEVKVVDVKVNDVVDVDESDGEADRDESDGEPDEADGEANEGIRGEADGEANVEDVIEKADGEANVDDGEGMRGASVGEDEVFNECKQWIKEIKGRYHARVNPKDREYDLKSYLGIGKQLIIQLKMVHDPTFDDTKIVDIINDVICDEDLTMGRTSPDEAGYREIYGNEYPAGMYSVYFKNQLLLRFNDNSITIENDGLYSQLLTKQDTFTSCC